MEKTAHRKILLINLAGVGDLLLSQPAVRALREAYPQSKICLLTSSKAGDMRDDFLFLDHWVTADVEYRGGLSGGRWLPLVRRVWQLRRERFDLAMNMRTLYSAAGSRKMQWLLRAIAARATAGRNTNGWGPYFTVSIPEPLQGQKYEMEYDIELVQLLGVPVADRTVTFSLPPQAVSRMQELLARERVGATDLLIGIHPGGMPSRRWPAERFSRLIDMLAQRYHAAFVLTGSSQEASLCSRIGALARARVVSTAGRLSLRELGALIRRCNVFVSNDTGPMHIAAVLQTPLVALFGPGDITRFDPRAISHLARVLYHPVACAPCEKAFCADGRCMSAISVEEAMAQVTQVLGQ
jgi:heptosyltransferase-2